MHGELPSRYAYSSGAPLAQVSALRLDLGASLLAVGDRVALNPTGRFYDGTEVVVEGLVTYQVSPLGLVAIQDDSLFADANVLASYDAYTAESSITVATTGISTFVVGPSDTAVLAGDTFGSAGATPLLVILAGRRISSGTVI